VIVFSPLGQKELRTIVSLLLSDVNLHLAERGLRVEVTDAAKEWLLEHSGIDPSTGARPLRRAIQRHVQDAVSDVLIHQQEDEGIQLISVDVEGDGLSLCVRSEPILSGS
jgi:ATP-dependent Clp protease ATP-binding subunit ClpA